MKSNRRQFLGTAAAASVFTILPAIGKPVVAKDSFKDGLGDEDLSEAAAKPVLDVKLFKEPVIIESIELLKKGKDYFVRVRSKDGAEGVSVDDGRMAILHPLLNRLVIPYFIGKDARELEEHLFGVYRYQSNYKYQGLALWVPVALVEFAILDMLGRIANKSIGELLGGIVRMEMPFYVASGRRDTTPEQEIEYLKSLVELTGAKAIKYRLGGRMNRNVDALPGRTEKLIPLTRKVFGDKMVIHGDANSSYDVAEGIRVGKLMQEIKAAFYEEPCPFDDFESTKRVADALEIPVALGEQESSEVRFRHCVRERVCDIVQPDLYYYGGLVRSSRVARMAERRKMPITPHLSGGFGFVYSLHFASCTPNIGLWQEYKKGVETYGKWFDPPLKIVDGKITLPKGAGVGIADPKEILKDATVVKDEGGAAGGGE